MALAVQGQFKLDDGTQAPNFVLTCNNAGLVRWAEPVKGMIRFFNTGAPYTRALPVANQYLLLAPATALGAGSADVSTPGAGLLQYNGTGPRHLTLSATFSFSAGVNLDYVFSLGVNNVPVTTCSAHVQPEVAQVALSATLASSGLDQVGVYALDPVGGGSVAIGAYQLNIW